MRKRTRMAAGLVATGLGVTWLAAPASAAPAEEFLLVCDNGESYPVLVSGNGEWTPGRVIGSNTVLIPVAFSDFSGRLFDPAGNEVPLPPEEEPPGPSVKGKGKQAERAGTTNCRFTIEQVSDGSDPEFPAGFRFVGEGTVTVKIAGRP